MRDRRSFLAACTGAAASAVDIGRLLGEGPSPFRIRGVVLLPEDLTLTDWPERAKKVGLTTIGIHHQNSPAAVIEWMKSDAGQRFREQCLKLRLEVEFELHAMKELLPRVLFAKNPDFFRMNDKGMRQSDSNCCVHSARALEIIAENALRIGKDLRPTTGRYFYWGDDGAPWCRCPKCKELSPSEQAVIIENRILTELRKHEPKAQVAHLAYQNTLAPPKAVKPVEGVFLEFAPINRRYDIPHDEQGSNKTGGLEALDANLRVFATGSAQVLEYWLDASRFSHWKRPAVRVPWLRKVFLADLEAYRKRGVKCVTTFAAWIDADYNRQYGSLDFLAEYGEGLNSR
jgi:hypothetical protein